MAKRRADDADAAPQPKRTPSGENMEDLLREHYARFYPWRKVYRWLSYGDPATFALREFAFGVRDMVWRFKSFADVQELRLFTLKHVPARIEFGAVYTEDPRLKHPREKEQEYIEEEIGRQRYHDLPAIEAAGKEFVIDVDVTDYDDVRTCCTGKVLCPKCWRFLAVATEVLDAVLRDDFGYRHRLWVYSGRRGIHAWVADARARRLSTEARGSIVQNLQPTPKYMNEKAFQHPSIVRAVAIMRLHIENIVNEQQLLADERHWGKILGVLPEALRARVEFVWRRTPPAQRWTALTAAVPPLAVTRVLFHVCYPRLDVNVSKKTEHLLKSPFCVHPETGNISIPFAPSAAATFNPTTVPTLHSVMAELNAHDRKHGAAAPADAPPDDDDYTDRQGRRRVADYKKTSLRAPYALFADFVTALENPAPHVAAVAPPAVAPPAALVAPAAPAPVATGPAVDSGVDY